MKYPILTLCLIIGCSPTSLSKEEKYCDETYENCYTEAKSEYTNNVEVCEEDEKCLKDAKNIFDLEIAGCRDDKTICELED